MRLNTVLLRLTFYDLLALWDWNNQMILSYMYNQNFDWIYSEETSVFFLRYEKQSNRVLLDTTTLLALTLQDNKQKQSCVI
jgi:phage anti-repressor protein